MSKMTCTTISQFKYTKKTKQYKDGETNGSINVIVVYRLYSNGNFIVDTITFDNLNEDIQCTHTHTRAHTQGRSHETDALPTEQHSLLVSTWWCCGHVTWCQRMLMLSSAAVQSQLLSENMSPSSLPKTGFFPCHSLFRDWTNACPAYFCQSLLLASVSGNSHAPR